MRNSTIRETIGGGGGTRVEAERVEVEVVRARGAQRGDLCWEESQEAGCGIEVEGKTEKEVDGLCERRHENCRGDRRGCEGQSQDGGARSSPVTLEMGIKPVEEEEDADISMCPVT